MISRQWMVRFITNHLHVAQQAPEHPVVPRAEEMTDELMDRWLESEVAFWASASGKRGLTPGQRTLRIQVSRFYEQRLTAHRAVSRDRDTESERT